MKRLIHRGRAALRWHLSETRRHSRDRLGALRYSLLARFRRRITKGAQVPGERLAIYTVFPQQGILQSHLAALRALQGNGYTPLVVSNLPLSSADRSLLAPHVWQIIERPNFGYDFGAYREGVRAIAPRLGQLRRLILLNDSVWFPLPGGADWPTRAEAMGVDLVGAVSNCAVAPPAPEDWRSFQWLHDTANPDFHYCSFALSLGPAALTHPAFGRFWARLRLTDDKFHTVRRGEVGLSQALIGAGLSHAETCDTAGLGERIAAMPLATLRSFVEGLVIPEDRALEGVRQKVLATPEHSDTLAELRRAALAIVALTGPAYAMPAYAHEVLNHPFLKKSPLRLALHCAQTSLRLTARLAGADGAAIHAEAKEIAAARFGAAVSPAHRSAP